MKEDRHDEEVYRKFLIRCAQGKEKFVRFVGKAGDLKTEPLSEKQNAKHRELILISFINNILGDKK